MQFPEVSNGGKMKKVEWLTTKFCGGEICKSARHIQLLCQSGKLKAKKYGRDWMIQSDVWEDYKAREFKDVQAS